jgi:hypothetical protein
MADVCKILGHFMLLIMKQNTFELSTKNTLSHSVKYSTFTKDSNFFRPILYKVTSFSYLLLQKFVNKLSVTF